MSFEGTQVRRKEIILLLHALSVLSVVQNEAMTVQYLDFNFETYIQNMTVTDGDGGPQSRDNA